MSVPRPAALRRHPMARSTSVVLAIVTVSAVVLGLILRSVAGIAFPAAFSNVAQLVSATAAAVSCRRAASRAEHPWRGPWPWLTASTAAWAAGELVWTVYEQVLDRSAPVPSFADVGFLLAVPFAVAGLMTFIDAPAGALSRLVGLVEASAIASGVVLTSWLVVLGDVFHATTHGLGERLITLAYPLGDCVVLAVALFVATRRTVRSPQTLGWIAAAFAAIAVSDTAFAVLVQADRYRSGSLVDHGGTLGFTLVAAAAAAGASDVARPAAIQRRRRALLVLPFAPLGMGVGVIGLALGRQVPLDPTSIWIGMVAAVLLCGHQVAVVLENDVLTADLERRVARRTEEILERERRFAALIEHSSDVTFLLDEAGAIRYASASVRSVFHLDPAAVLGSRFTALLGADDEHEVAELLAASAARPGTSTRAEVTLVGGGDRHVTELSITNLVHDEVVNGIVVNGRDISARRGLEDQLRHDALHDGLTGLSNRRMLLDHMQLALEHRRERTSTVAALLVLDLDDFKSINDGFGHPAGDEFLMSVADRLRRCVRPSDTVARLGGDEFAILLADVDPDAVAASAERLLEVLQLPVSTTQVDVAAPASIGVRIMTGGESPQLVLRDADIALYAAKQAGKQRVAWFDPAMGESALRTLTLKSDLRTAWDRGEMAVCYQPIVELGTGALRGAEALARWTHPTFGTVSPVEFIPLAESTGTIVELGLAVLHEACRRAVEWGDHPTCRSISVNVSPVQIASDRFLGDVDRVLASTGLAPQRLLLEVTEGVLLGNFEAAIAVLEQLRERGVRTAIDDFGTGYSSLAYAQRLPVDVVKLDQAFVAEAASPASVVPAMVQIAGVLDAMVVAEGIEQADQAEVLRSLGCELGQGFLYSPPVPASSFQRLLAHGTITPLGAARRPAERLHPTHGAAARRGALPD